MDDDIIVEIKGLDAVFIKKPKYDELIRMTVWKEDSHMSIHITPDQAKQIADALMLCVDQK